MIYLLRRKFNLTLNNLINTFCDIKSNSIVTLLIALTENQINERFISKAKTFEGVLKNSETEAHRNLAHIMFGREVL